MMQHKYGVPSPDRATPSRSRSKQALERAVPKDTLGRINYHHVVQVVGQVCRMGVGVAPMSVRSVSVTMDPVRVPLRGEACKGPRRHGRVE